MNCDNCKFAHHGPSHKEGDLVACRRMPPTLMYTPVQRLNLAGEATLDWQTAAAYPLVNADNWCGEHQVAQGSAIRLS